jgi:hypothetical protein
MGPGWLSGRRRRGRAPFEGGRARAVLCVSTGAERRPVRVSPWRPRDGSTTGCGSPSATRAHPHRPRTRGGVGARDRGVGGVQHEVQQLGHAGDIGVGRSRGRSDARPRPRTRHRASPPAVSRCDAAETTASRSHPRAGPPPGHVGRVAPQKARLLRAGSPAVVRVRTRINATLYTIRCTENGSEDMCGFRSSLFVAQTWRTSQRDARSSSTTSASGRRWPRRVRLVARDDAGMNVISAPGLATFTATSATDTLRA